MHQPQYKDTISGEYSLPWARLHALKDYLHMAEMVAEQPPMHVTFNLVPCLLEQLEDYAQGEATDRCLALSLQDTWSPEEKEFMLSFFFNINWDRFIRRYPRYWQLLELRQRSEGRADLFGDAYYRDLAAWFNLAWIDRNTLERDETLKSLVEKGRDLSSEDLRTIADKQREIIGQIIPLYRALEKRRQIEITTSPYYHPVLPLLADIRSAREANPRLPLPATAISYPEDAVEQLRRAITTHEKHFGRRPRGLWPSEGSVSQALISLLARVNGFHWIATDEGILAQSLRVPIQRDGSGHVTNPQVLYRPYRVGSEGGQSGTSRKLQVIFRDVLLSDRIGFVYKHTPSEEAVNDLIGRLHRIRQNLNDKDSPYLVSIILDGENCWEEYEDNGTPFLRNLYYRLSHDPELQPVTVSEYLDRYPAQETIPHLYAGSWNNHSFETWIGERAQNRAWEYLARTRQWLATWQRENPLEDLRTLEQAWEEIYIAEASDWFWWYYSRNNPTGENLFDREFRRHLRNVYRLTGVSSPSWLNSPIVVATSDERQRPVTGYITPPLDAREVISDQWKGAGYIEPETSTGAMQRSQEGVRRLYYGYDEANLYFRLESVEDLSSLFVGIYLAVPHASKTNQYPRHAETKGSIRLPSMGFQKEIAFRGWTDPVILSRATGQEVWEQQMILPARVSANVAEVKIPFSALDAQLGDILSLVLVVARDHVITEVLPSSDQLSFALEELA